MGAGRWRAVAPSCGSEVRRPPAQMSAAIRGAGAAPPSVSTAGLSLIMICAAECLGDRVSKVTLLSPTCDSVGTTDHVISGACHL